MWGAEEESSFLVEKEMLLQDKVLMHYDPDLPLVLATDSSSYCILELSCHTILWKVKSGPLLMHPGSLSKPEKKYSQIEKEVLSLVWGVRKFQTYRGYRS